MAAIAKVADEKDMKPKLKAKKEIEPGIIYLSRIPTYMCVKKIRQVFSVYGEIGRVFLQPDERASANKKNQVFTEGWVEFLDKRIAKRVTVTLNNRQVGGKRSNPWYEEIWNIKYLPKFKWGHLNERLAYEREVHKHRLRTEVAQAKRETAFYIQNVEKRQIQKKLEKKGKQLDTVTREWDFRQKDTEKEFAAKKRKRAAATSEGDVGENSKASGKREPPAKKTKSKRTDEDSKKLSQNKSLLQSIFSGGLQASSDED